ncbi:DUF11 domain-containing protein [Humibacter sp. BT305]|nr:DUF11 domain-containing protein [Humibacter sp. BT305]
MRRTRFGLAVAAVFALVLGGLFVAAPAYAADAALVISKVVDGQPSVTVDPDDEFTYTISVGCNDNDCVDATMADPLPAAWAGFPILAKQVVPASQPATLTLDGCETVVTEDCTLRAAFQQPLPGGGTGIVAGVTYQISLTLKVPANLPASWPSNGVAVTNTATAQATTADTVSASADVTIAIPVRVDTAVGKTWAPSTQQFQPGVASTITLTNQNTSNLAAETLTAQDPTSAVDGQSGLGADNPFRLVDFAGFGQVTLPAGADQVQVDAYALDPVTNVYRWVTGSPAPPSGIALPAGVAAGDVTGLRLVYSSSTGATIAPSGSAGSVQLQVSQRSTDRQSGDSLNGGGSVTNQVTGSVHVPGQTDVSKTASAPYSIGALTVSVAADKTITPSRIPAGFAARATISGTNTSNGPLSTLLLEDRDFFTDEILFDGFASPISYPDGAVSAGTTVTWYFSDGSDVVEPLADGSTPSAPAAPGGAHLTGFGLSFAGAIPTGGTTAVQFGIRPTVDLVDPVPADGYERLTNALKVTGTNAVGSATAGDTADLQVFTPDISLTTAKTIQPQGAVSPGATVVAQLPTATSTDSAFVNPTQIVVTDAWAGPGSDPNGFYNAFNPLAIAPTQVLGGSSLLVEYTTDGTTWQTLETYAAQPATRVVQDSIDPALVPVITGLRFTFANPDGFAQGTSVSPNLVFQARATQRDGGAPTSVPNAGPTTYVNTEVAVGKGEVPGLGPIESTPVNAQAPASIVSNDGVGTLLASKQWLTADFSRSLDLLDSQSAEQGATRLGWGVTSTGYSQVVVADPNGGETTPGSTVFQAFDLVKIAPTTYTQDPLLRFDTISAVELYDSTANQWAALTPPAGGWMGSNGFLGANLTPAQQQSTTGVRFTITPNDAARSGSTNPLAPPVGSGVSTSATGSARPLGLVWQLRNTVRVADGLQNPWVTAKQTFNDGAPGSIVNTVGVSGVQNGTPVGPRGAQDTIALIDQPPGVDVTKTSQKSQMVIPQRGDVDPAAYPTNDFTVTAKNTSSSRASYIRVSDPMTCTAGTLSQCVTGPADWGQDPYASATYDPTTNTFERFTLTGLDFSVTTSQVDRSQSTVTLWKRAQDGTLSTEQLSVDAADGLAASALTDVVGVSVLYQGTDPTTRGGSIGSAAMTMTLHTQLRLELRRQPGTTVVPFAVDNYAFGQSYDPVLFPSGVGSTPSDSANASIQLLKGNLGVTASKTFSPDSVLEAHRGQPIRMTLGATQGDQTVPTNQVTVQDVDPEFWNAFALTGLTASDVVFPAGANRVDVGLQVNGAGDWYTTGAQATPTLPTLPAGAELDDVTGVRFVFTRDANGSPALFSNTAPPQPWSTSITLPVVLRAADRVSGAPIVFPGSIDNEVTTNSHRFEDPTLYPDANASATDSVTLDAGTFSIDVSKDPQAGVHTVLPGDPNLWTLTFRNSGTGYLTVDSLVDTLPTTLEWDGAPLTFSTSTGGTLSTSPTTAYDPATRQLTLTWPTDGRTMAPGEKFTIQAGIVLQPGLMSNQRATNQFVVTTAQTLTACTNTSGNGQGTVAGLPSTECGATNYVQPIPGASLLTTKSVKGDVVDPVDPANPLVSGAQNVTSPGTACVADAEGFYRSPCAANTVVGGVDEWKLFAQNSGTIGYRTLTIVDPLPFAGDRLLATGASRGSTYTPALTGLSDISVLGLPTGVTPLVEVTTAPAPQVCVGTGTSAWPADPDCSEHPPAGQWTAASAFTGSWADVTGLRVTIDFTARADNHAPELSPGEAVTVTYRSVNVPASADDPDRAPVTVPVSDAIAWNQNGAVADLVGGGQFSRSPIKAGVVMPTGSLQVTKAVTGAGSAYAPSSFQADVTCTVAGGAPVDMGSFGTLTLDAANSYTARIDGIPLGADCAIAEAGQPGSYGESTRSVAPTSVLIRTAGGAGDPVPAHQQATITNDYALTSLVVSKAVSTLATVGSFGPFTYQAVCTTALGAPIPLAAGDATFQLADGGSKTISGLPVLADCTVTETDSDAATSVSTVANGVDGSGQAASVALTAGANSIAFTNLYAAGTLAVTKTVNGTGGDEYGDGPFTLQVVCSYGGAEVYRDSFVVTGGETETVPEVFPAGTQCAISETVDGGANETVIDQPTVVIPGPTGTASLGAVTVDVTNTFNEGSVHVTKVRDGAGADAYGAGPFTAQVTCTWVKDGQTLTIPLPDGGVVVLDEANGYEATVDGLIQGASCTITETKTGGASSVAFDPADPASPSQALVTVPNGTAAEATITNTFLTGSLVIDKKRIGDGVELFGDGPFTAQVVCEYLVDGVVTPIDLPDDGIVTLSADDDWTATLDGLIADADCVVTETDAGLAVDTTLDPEDGAVTVLADGDPAGPVTVTITNRFDVGQLTVTKTVDKAAALVGDTLAYTITVANAGQIDATAVTVSDVLPAGLRVTAVDPAGTAGSDAAGAATLTWTIDSLPVGASRSFSVIGVATTAGTLENTATISTPPGPWLPPSVPGHPGDTVAKADSVITVPVLPGDLADTGSRGATLMVIGGVPLLFGAVLLVLLAYRRRHVA